jgi:hypothetical protein
MFIYIIVDYWTSETVINIKNRHNTGTVTKIYDIDNLSMFDQCMIIDGMYVVPFGNFIRYPSSEGRWTKNRPFIATDAVAPDKRYEFVVGENKDSTRKKLTRISNEFKQITKKARRSFQNSVTAGVSTHYCHIIIVTFSILIYSLFQFCFHRNDLGNICRFPYY